MSYHIEGKDIVIDGFEQGIGDSPLSGITDMRNIDPVTIPGEASVAFSTVNNQPMVTALTFTAVASTDIITWSGTATSGTVSDRLAITVSNSGGGLPGGLTASTTYYIRNSTTTTFQLSATPGGSIIDITTAGTGTQSFSTINIDRPTYTCSGKITGNTVDTYYFFVDLSNRAWYWNGTLWQFLNNPAGTTFKGCGIVAWHNYLFVFHDTVIDYLHFTDLPAETNTWVSNWQSITAAPIHEAIVGTTDDVVYFANVTTLGTWFQVAGTTFDPSNSATYQYNAVALQLPASEYAQCVSQLQTNILAGGVGNVVYSWDRISLGYIPIFISDNNTAKIVSVNTSAYFFTGTRGRIYITNGNQVQLLKKMPDHLSGTVNPLYTWGGAAYQKGNLYFGVQATDTLGNAINQYGGLWALDLETKSLRLSNQLSYGNYSGRATTILPILGSGVSQGYGMFIGWMNTLSSETDGVDITSSLPYTGGQSYVESDLIPVGTFFQPNTPAQVEWKTSVPIGNNGTSETITLSYLTNQSDTAHTIGTTTCSTGFLVGGASAISDGYQTNFEKVQWVKIRATLTSNATTPTYNRLTQIRLREYKP